MLKLLPILLVLAIIAVIVSCKPTKDAVTDTADIKETPENNPDELIGITWSVSYIQELDARLLPKKSASITFKEGNQAKIGLSVNSCFASYKASPTMIKIIEEGCTEKCCDDDFDKQLLALIRGNEFSYELKNGKLTLSATNSKIVLSK